MSLSRTRGLARSAGTRSRRRTGQPRRRRRSSTGRTRPASCRSPTGRTTPGGGGPSPPGASAGTRSPRTPATQVLGRLRDEGPLTATQLGGAKAGGPWWDWSEVKIAAEWLLDTGRAVCVRRTGWRRVYDLPERVDPERSDRPRADRRGVPVLPCRNGRPGTRRGDPRGLYRVPAAQRARSAHARRRGARRGRRGGRTDPRNGARAPSRPSAPGPTRRRWRGSPQAAAARTARRCCRRSTR